MNEFSAGAVIGRSLSIWGRNIVSFSLLLLLVHLPLILYLSMATELDTTMIVLVFLGQQALDLLAIGAVVYGVFQQLRGQPASFVSCVVVGLGRFFPVLGVGFLVLLCFVGALTPIMVLGGALVPVMGSLAAFLILAAGLPIAMIILCMLWVAIPAAVVERPGLLGSLRRSRELTRGYKGSIFGITFVLHLLTAGIAWILGKILNATLEDAMIVLVVSQGIEAILGGIHAVSAAVGYHDLRQAKEGVGIEELVRVFE